MGTHAQTLVAQELEPNFCIVHTNSHSCAPDHHTRECEDFVELSPRNKWMIVNKERICPLCIVAQHQARKCPLRNGVTMCQNCHYTHAREMGCRPPETIWRREEWHCFNIASSQHRDESSREILPPPPPPKRPKRRKKKSKAASREKLPHPQRLESPQEDQISSISTREKGVAERPRKRVSWPPE